MESSQKVPRKFSNIILSDFFPQHFTNFFIFLKSVNLHLSEYGYSVNANDNIRKKCLFNALNEFDCNAVKNRLSEHYSSYRKKSKSIQNENILSHILSDFKWVEDMRTKIQTNQYLDYQREKSRHKLIHKIQSKKNYYHRK